MELSIPACNKIAELFVLTYFAPLDLGRRSEGIALVFDGRALACHCDGLHWLAVFDELLAIAAGNRHRNAIGLHFKTIYH